MLGIPRKVEEHRLCVQPDARSIKQKLRWFTPERIKAIEAKVKRLLEVGFIKPVNHPIWLANPVLVPKPNGKLRMCVDFTDLNKACQKDTYPFPWINQIVDSTSICEYLFLLNMYSGYHQISMPSHHSFWVEEGRSYVPAGDALGLLTTNQPKHEILHRWLGGKVKKKVQPHLRPYQGLQQLAKNKIMFKPKKCILGVEQGKILGFMVSQWGIEVNPHKR